MKGYKGGWDEGMKCKNLVDGKCDFPGNCLSKSYKDNICYENLAYTKGREDALSVLTDVYKGLGWQGGTIHQVIEEIKRLKKIEIKYSKENLIKVFISCLDNKGDSLIFLKHPENNNYVMVSVCELGKVSVMRCTIQELKEGVNKL